MLAESHFPLPVKAVVVDLDGTLLDTISDLALAANLTRIELGMESLSEQRIKAFVGLGLNNLVRCSLREGSGREPEARLLAAAVAIFERRYGEVLTRSASCYPGVREGLRAMREEGFRLACITNKAERFTLPLLGETELTPFFELILSGDSLPKAKPDPLPLLHAARHFGVAPGEIVLIGDSHNDTEAARAAGCYVFVVPYGYRGGRHISEFDADAIVPGLVEAAKLIKNIPN